MNKDAILKITPTQIETQALNFEDALILISSALLQLMRGNLASAPNDPELRQAIYDSVNQAMANVLDKFDPSQSPNPDFDPQTELENENRAIMQQLRTLKENNPRLYKRRKKEYDDLLSEQRARVIQANYARLSALPKS